MAPRSERHPVVSSAAADHNKASVSLAFALLDQKPRQETNFDFRGVLLESARERLPVLVEQKLRRLLR